jgi:5S rRNA maturation endonuclease (ribonuclease M5)
MNILNFGKTPREVTERISREVPRDAQLRALLDIYPEGVQRGKEFFIGSLRGEAGKSLRINIDTSSPWFMTGKDFESGDGIGGICKVLKEAKGYSLSETIDYFKQYISMDYVAPPENIVKPNNLINLSQVQNKPEQKIQINSSTPFEDEYLYTDEHGVILVAVRKYFDRDVTGEIVRDNSGKPKKQFRQFVDGRQGVPEPRPLYNIPNILSSNKVIWVEGEKCADALKDLGYAATCTIGGAGMLSENTASKFDFTPLRNKELILWPDNDEAGKKLARIVEAQAKEAGAKSTLMLKIPASKEEKWDAADAISDGFDIEKFFKSHESKIKKPISLLDESLLIDKYFVGSPPEQHFLIGDTIPLGVPVVFAAAGDSGKGMMTLDLAMKVSSGASMQSSFGGLVASHGDAVIFTAEDDKDEMHRRISRLDPKGYREHYDHSLRILPLPNLGGVFPVMQKFDNSYVMGDEFSRIYEQMLEMENLKLIVIDPMASFVHADVNADPAAGAAFMGMLAQMATETGATVMVNHHMAKIKDDKPVTTPEEARNMIRGTSAIVDGVRAAFAVWPVTESVGKQRCKDLNIKYTRNGVFDGAVVKSNGPANRDFRHFMRNQDTGLLEDRTADLTSVQYSQTVRDRLDLVFNFVAEREAHGNPVTKGGKTDGLFEMIRIAPEDDLLAANIRLLNLSSHTLEGDITKLQNSGRVGQYKITRSGPKKFIGVVGGNLHSNEPTID